MPSISDYFKYAETAFAAYAFDLAIGKGNISKYIAAEMTSSQAQRFDAAWQVLGQQELWDGFSAVLLQPVDAQGEGLRATSANRDRRELNNKDSDSENGASNDAK